MKNMESIISKMNSMSEAERKEFVMEELTLEEIYELYNSYGYATELGNGAVEAVFEEGEKETDNAVSDMENLVDLLYTMSETERADYIYNNCTIEEAYKLYEEYGYVTELGDGKVAASYNEVEKEYDHKEAV